MAKATVVKKHNGGTIAQNKRARHDYFIEEKFEAGMSLLGWEVKSLRAGRMSLTESYVIFKMVKHSYLVLRFNHSFLHLHILCRKLRVHENYYYLVVNLKSLWVR